MIVEKSQELRWLRLYKLIACIGVAAMIPPVFEALTYWIARQYSTATTLLTVPWLLIAGYGIQSVFLLGHHTEKGVIIDHGFETDKETIPLRRKLPAWLLSAGAGAVTASVEKSIILSLVGDDANIEFGFPVFLASCVLTAISGCILKPLKYHQILSIRTVIGCLFIFSLIFAFEFFIWDSGGIDLLFVSCFIIYTFCLGVLMNQEYVTKPAATFPACHATDRLRTAGIVSVIRLAATVLVFQIPILSAVSLAVIPSRALKYNGIRQIFQFPVDGAVALNVFFFIFGLIIVAVAVVWLIARSNAATVERVREFIAELRQKIKDLLMRFLESFSGKGDERYRREKESVRIETQHYVDTVSFRISPKEPRTITRYSLFLKRLKSCRTEHDRYCLAYRVLIDRLCASNIGIGRTLTPLEMVNTVKSQTDIVDFDKLTNLFTAEVYGEKEKASPDDVSKISEMLRYYLE